MNIITVYKQAINESWIGTAIGKRAVSESIHPGDWNGWCHGALLTIDHEHGLMGPLEMYDIPELKKTFYASEEWIKIAKRADELSGAETFCEPINGAISGVYSL